jgi:hypothetical protein
MWPAWRGNDVPKSPLSVASKATVQARPRPFRQFKGEVVRRIYCSSFRPPPAKEGDGDEKDPFVVVFDGGSSSPCGGAVLALPSEVPDDTPMVDGRVRAIEQLGTNIWLT